MPGKFKLLLYFLLFEMLIMTGCAINEVTTVTPEIPLIQPTAEKTSTTVVATEPVVPETSETQAAVQPAEKCHKIAFSQYDGVNYEILCVCPDGSQLVNLTNDPADDVDPVWSPDGTKIAFSSSRSGHFQIYLMSVDGSEVTALTSDFENLKPVWLPDGKQLAFRTDDGRGMYWWRILNLENSELTTISEPSYDFFYQTPAWSPDGKQIAYMSLVEQQERNDGSSQIHVKNVDGTHDVALTQDTWANFNPKWSPDGSKIAFVSERGGTYNMFALYMMNSDGTDVQQLTDANYPADVVYAWSPNGGQIVIGNNNLFTGISIIDINSKTSKPLMAWPDPANVTSPSWQP